MNYDKQQIKTQILQWTQNYNQPPAWNQLAKQFNLSKKMTKSNSSMIPLRKYLKNWYQQEIYSKRTTLPKGIKIRNEIKLSRTLNWQTLSSEQFLKIKSTQKKILQWLQNYKQPPAWIKVAFKFNLSLSKNRSSLREYVKEWYQREIFSNRKFYGTPGVNKTNKSKLSNKKKTNKRARQFLMDIEKEKRKILNWVQNKTEPLNWVHIASHFYYYQKYTSSARRPLQEWYNKELYPDLIKKATDTINQQFFDIENSEKDVSLSQSIVKGDLLKELFIECFESCKTYIENTISIVENPQHYEYYNNFFKCFMPKLSSCCLPDNIFPARPLNYLESYHQVYDLASFKEYLKKTPGLYSKMSLWAIDYPFPFPNSAICNRHHCLPRFLYNKKNGYGFSKQEIEKPYNLVDLGWLVHYLFHLTRLMEYNQVQDYAALGATIRLVKRQGPNRNLIAYYKKWDFMASQMQVLNDCLKNCPDLNVSKTSLSSPLIKILTQNTQWRHCQGFLTQDGQVVEFSFTHLAQNPHTCSLENLANLLIETDQKRSFITGLPKQIPEDNREKVIDNIRHYLARIIRKQKMLTLYGFYFTNAESPVPKWSELLPYNSYIGQKVPPTKIAKARFIVKYKNPVISDIVGSPGDFETIKHLVDLCAKKQHESLGLTLSSKNYYKLKDYFTYRIEMPYQEDEQHQFRLDWHLTLLPLV